MGDIGLATDAQARAAIDGLLREKQAEIEHARRTDKDLGRLARLRRQARTRADEIRLAAQLYVGAARHFLNTPVVLPPMSPRVVAILYGVLAVVDLVTLRAIFAQADFDVVDSWTLPVAFTVAIVGAVTLVIRFGLSAVEAEYVKRAKRKIVPYIVVALVLGLSMLVVGLAVKANSGSVRFGPSQQLRLWGGYAMFAGLLILQASLSAALAAYQYTDGATQFGRARSNLRSEEKKLRELVVAFGDTERDADEIEAKLRNAGRVSASRAGAGRLIGLDRSFRAPRRGFGRLAETVGRRAGRVVAAIPLPVARYGGGRDVDQDYRDDLERFGEKGRAGASPTLDEVFAQIHRPGGPNGSSNGSSRVVAIGPSPVADTVAAARRTALADELARALDEFSADVRPAAGQDALSRSGPVDPAPTRLWPDVAVAAARFRSRVEGLARNWEGFISVGSAETSDAEEVRRELASLVLAIDLLVGGDPGYDLDVEAVEERVRRTIEWLRGYVEDLDAGAGSKS